MAREWFQCPLSKEAFVADTWLTSTTQLLHQVCLQITGVTSGCTTGQEGKLKALLAFRILYIMHTALYDVMIESVLQQIQLPDSNSNHNDCVGWAWQNCTLVVLCTTKECMCAVEKINKSKFDNQLYVCMCQLFWTNLPVDVDQFDNCFRQVWRCMEFQRGQNYGIPKRTKLDDAKNQLSYSVAHKKIVKLE